jgi:hypothetical protein
LFIADLVRSRIFATLAPAHQGALAPLDMHDHSAFGMSLVKCERYRAHLVHCYGAPGPLRLPLELCPFYEAYSVAG